MLFINCWLLVNWVELKHELTIHVVLAPGGVDNINSDPNNIIFIIFTVKYTKSFVPVVTLWENDNRKLSKLLITWF